MIRWKHHVLKESLYSKRPTSRLARLDLLFPPFMQRKPSTLATPRTYKSSEWYNTIRSEVISEDRVTTCKDIQTAFFDAVNLDSREELVVSCPISCGGKCKMHDLTGEELESSAEIADDEAYDVFEFHDWDYEAEDPGGDETREGEKEKTSMPWLAQCESFSTIRDPEEDQPNTTDPYLSHKLNVPYNQVPKMRYFNAAGQNAEYVADVIPKRPRSPVRKLLPGKFDLKAATEEWSKKHQISETEQYLRESKERIAQSLKRLSQQQPDSDVLISSTVLQTVREEVTLRMSQVKIDIDINTFVNVAVIWALSEMNIFNIDMLMAGFSFARDFPIPFEMRNKIAEIMGPGGMRKTLMGTYRAPFSRNVYTTLHCRLPWHYVCPSHERGHMKLYPNVRERINEKFGTAHDESMSTYVSDLVCTHLVEVVNKSYVAYKRKSRSISMPSAPSVKMIEDMFVQFMSLS